MPTLVALRMQRWALILQAYNYDIEYRRSADHGNADALSRWLSSQESSSEEASIFHVAYIHDLPVSAADIAKETRKDVILSSAGICTHWLAKPL